MKTNTLKFFIVVLGFVLCSVEAVRAQIKPTHSRMNINNMGYWYRSDGHSRYSPNGTQHIIFPEGTSTACASDGVIWGGNAYLDAAHTQPAPGQLFRMGGQFRGQVSFQAGPIDGFGASAVARNAADADVRIYRVRRDYRRLAESELRLEAAQMNQVGLSLATSIQMQAVLDQYERDWNEWPVQMGAPYIDRNKNGVYDKPPAFSDTFTVDSLNAGNYDEPGVAGVDPNSPADQVIWTVNNNLSPNSDLFATQSDGCEAQHTLWAYKRTGALGQALFRRVKIINKGGVTISGGQKAALYLDSVYIAVEADPDLGDFTEDLIGVDTTASLAYIYNAFARDRQYASFGIPPPALGFDFLQGPRVPAPGDSAVFNIKRIHGWKNLPVTSFAFFSSGSAIADPPATTYEGALRFKKMFRGYVPDPSTAADRFYPFPPGMTPNKFPLSGDPVTGSGFVDGLGTQYSFAPGDRRIVFASGPFTLAPGDTQELVVAYVGGLGADRLSSVAVMKFNDRFVQNTYDALFQVPNAPTPPTVNVAELDERIVLEWGSDLDRIANTEGRENNPGAYQFEGYNVYQFPSRSSTLADARRLATYDVLPDPTVILDERFDNTSGQILSVPVQFGTNSGIKRVFEFRRDYVRDIDKVYNGQEYYVAVTAYSHSKIPGYVPASIESDPIILTVRPRVPFGKVLLSVYGDTIQTTHTGKSEGVVQPLVVDPSLSTGDSYEVSFEGTPGNTTWKLTNKTRNTIKLTGQTNQAGDDLYPIVDGMVIKVIGPTLLQGKSGTVAPSASRWYNGMSGFGGELLNSSVRLGARFLDGSGLHPGDYKAVEIRFVVKSGYTDLTGNGAYNIGEPYTVPAAGSQKAFMYTSLVAGSYEGFYDIPFTAWDVSNPAAPVQLNVVVHDPDRNQQWDLHANVTNPALPNNGDQRNNYIWIAATPYDATGKTYDPTQGGTDWMSLSGTKPSLWAIGMQQRTAAFEPYGAPLTLSLVPNLINTPQDVFTFASPGVQSGAEVEKSSAEEVGVFPNPYFAFNPAETSRFQRFVTFHSLTPKAIVRIFNLAGELVRVLKKDDASQFMIWDLANYNRLPVGSGMYIAHVEMEMPSDGTKVSKALKFAIIQEKEVLDVY